MDSLNLETLMQLGSELSLKYGIIILKAIVVLLIGLKAIKMIKKAVLAILEKKQMDISLRSFFDSLVDISLKACLTLSVLGILGIQTTSFVAIFGAVGLAIGMSLQGALGNLAGGVLILVFRPFKVGDVVEVQGHTGAVKEIQIFCTVLNTPDRKTIIIPNGPLSSGNIINYSKEPIRRVDMTFGIGYGDDLKLAKETLLELAKGDERILQDPATEVYVAELADSSVNFSLRVFVKSENYWPVYFAMHENVKLRFDEKGISIPFPQQDVHLYKNS